MAVHQTLLPDTDEVVGAPVTHLEATVGGKPGRRAAWASARGAAQ